MTQDPIPGNGRNEAFSRLLAVVKRLEWTGLTAEGKANCPVCGAAGPGGSHAAACELKSALDATTSRELWPWCHCDACECPNRVDPALNSGLCRDCAHGSHHADRAPRDP